MKAIVFKKVGGIPEMTNVSIQACGQEVEVKLNASSLNHRDLWITKGLYPGLVEGKIMGADGVGMFNNERVIINPGIQWGANEDCQSSDFRVLGIPDNGTFSEKIVIEERYLHPCPEHLSDVEAAALPLAGVTAYRSLMVKCNPRKGDNVLISGIGGGVATMAMLFALHHGCEVFVTSGSEDKIKKAVGYGARRGYNYKNAEWVREVKADKMSFHVIIDSAGGSGFKNLVGLLAPGGRICFYGGGEGVIDGLNPQVIFWKQLSIMGSTMGSEEDFKNMLQFVTHFKIRPIIDGVYSIHDYKKAFEKMEEGKQFGKLVFHHDFEQKP